MTNKQPDWQVIAKYMLLSRSLDRLETENLTPQGKVKLQFSAAGHELAQVLLVFCLDHPHDAASVYYRSRAFMLAAGLDPVEALAAGMAKTQSPSQGRDVGVVFNRPGQGKLTVLPSSGAVGAQFTPAAGWAQAITYRRDILGETDWIGALAVALGGDASVAANGFWSALNIATTLLLPMLFFIEDNGFGLSVPSSYQTPGGNIAANLAAFSNLRTMDCNGSDPQVAWENISTAVKYVRDGNGPCLIRVSVPRLAGHTFIDDQSYKKAEILESETERDPLIHMKAHLLSTGFKDDSWNQMTNVVDEQIRNSLEKVITQSDPGTNQVMKYMFFDGNAPIQGGLRPEGVALRPGFSKPENSGPRINMVEAIKRTLKTEMQFNRRILVYGEDVGLKGGVHAATLDLQSRFGDRRVFDTSLSEEGIIGRAVGLALAGLLPVPEIQFRKYADPAMEQINDLGTLRWRTANRFAAPVVVRIPVGFGKNTGDPWHSVSAEAVFAHHLGWRIAYPSNAQDAAGLLRSALRGDDPTFFLEHRALLDTSAARRPYPGDDYCLDYGRGNTVRIGDELTVITWGAMVSRCLEVARQFSNQVEIIDLRTILPWDLELAAESIRKTGKLLVVHEDTHTAGFGAEIIATLSNQVFTYLDAPPDRLAMPDLPIPYNTVAMKNLLPDIPSIQAKILSLLSY